MHKRSRRQGALALLLPLLPLLPAPAARAQTLAPPASAASAPPGADTASLDLRGWLLRIHDAAQHRNYVGTMVNNAGGTVSGARVTHFCEGPREYERVEAMDGEPRGVVRMNDEVRTLWPRQRVAVVEAQDPRAAFPALVTGSEQRIPDFYELRPLSPERVAGRDADRMLLKARDHLRFDQMIWTDRASGLLLRVDLQDDGRTIESSMFTDVLVGMRPQPGQIVAEMRRAEGYRIVRPPREHTRLEAEGWVLRHALPPGFQPVDCVKRGLPGAGQGGADTPVLQAIYSDGLTHVSVFIEPYDAKRHHGGALTVIGATHTLTRRMNDDWLTAVGDVPPPTLELFLLALDRKR